MIVSFTVRQAVTLKEVACAQRLFTLNADEMLRMPETSQGRNHLHFIIIKIQKSRETIVSVLCIIIIISKC